MGGLLDKANAAKDESVIEAEVIEAETIVEEVKADPPKDSNSSAEILDDSSSEGNSLSFANISTNGKIGYGLALVGFILMWPSSGFNLFGLSVLQDVLGFIPLWLVPVSLFGCSFYLIWDAVDRQKTIVLSICTLLLIVTPVLAGITLGGSAAGISDLSIDEKNDKLTFLVRGSFFVSSVTASISADGAEVWTESGEMSNNLHRFEVSLSDIFVTNAQDYDSSILTNYELTVTTDEGESSTIPITPELMNREMNDASVKFSTLTEIINDDTTDESRVVAKGIRIELALGLMNPSDGPMDGGGSSLTTYKTITTDYSVDVNVMFGGNVVWSHSTITVDGIDATWNSQVSGAVSGQTVYWIGLSGTAEDDSGAEYLERDQFYEDDGCYTFEVTITNDLYSSSPTTVIDEYAWDLSWDSDEADSENSVCS
ncbi:MAG: hypothetical protein NZ736_03530 [Candidatus Poseidoniaceae archaeon]|nr:hypothetical protein [Candidatus Poseidoniaceae archaeon]